MTNKDFCIKDLQYALATLKDVHWEFTIPGRLFEDVMSSLIGDLETVITKIEQGDWEVKNG